MVDRQYPIGRIALQDEYSSEARENLIQQLEQGPARYRAWVGNLTEVDLDKKYREGGWNIRQLVHHVADIALLYLFRMKRAITEPGSDMLTLQIDAWAQTMDVVQSPVEPSLLILEGITPRYVQLIRSLTDEERAMAYYHPVRQLWLTQDQAMAMSAWHLKHHLAHIQLALGKEELEE